MQVAKTIPHKGKKGASFELPMPLNVSGAPAIERFITIMPSLIAWCMQWLNRQQFCPCFLAACSDEIYANSVFGSQEFISTEVLVKRESAKFEPEHVSCVCVVCEST
jgi:hypothetical protein